MVRASGARRRRTGRTGRHCVPLRVLLALCLPCAVQAASKTALAAPMILTEEQAIQLFYDRNLDLLAARYSIESAQAQEIVAAAIPNPMINVTILELSSRPNLNSPARGCSQAFNNECGPAAYYAFSQLIEMAGKRGLRMQSSAIGAQAAESDFRDAVRILTNMVRDAYYALLLAQKTRWLAQEIVAHYKSIVGTNRLRNEAGDISKSDFLRIEVESFKAQSDLTKAEAVVKQDRANLAVTLAWPDQSLQLEAAEKWPDIKEIGQSLSEQALINMALPTRPDLQADRDRAAQAEKELTLARRLKFPDITVSGGQARDPSNTNLNTYFVGVSVPIPLFYQYEGELGKAATNLNQARLAAEGTELDIRNDVVNALAAWQSADFLVRQFESGLLERVQNVRDIAELSYHQGATSVLDLIEAQRNYKAVMLDYYVAVINRVNAYYDLAKAIGIDPDADANPAEHRRDAHEKRLP